MNMYGYEETPMFVDIRGRRVERTPYSHPYNYDEFVQWKSSDFNSHKDSGVYSDRLMQWDLKKYEKCCKEAFGNSGHGFHSRQPKNIEKFLTLYLEEEVVLTAIIQGCYWTNGFPYWAFYYRKK